MYLLVEISLQTVLAFFAIFFFSRIIGKKQISELTFYDYINGITFGSIAGVMATDFNHRTWQHFFGLFLFAFLTFLLQYISLKNRTAQKIIEGEPVILVHRGKILEENMKEARYNIGDLLSELRKNKVFDIRDVQFALLETDGKLSVLTKSEKMPLTREDLDIKVEEETIPVELIVDGKVIQSNLSQNNIDIKWLDNLLEQKNIDDIKEVLLALYNPQDKSVYIDLREDNLGKDTIDISDDVK